MNLAEAQAVLFSLTFGDGAVIPDGFLRWGGVKSASLQRRLAVYRSVAYMRAADSLELMFRHTSTVSGATAFHRLVLAYLAEPIDRPQTRQRLLAGFPGFLRRADELPRPDLADLAELELARQRVLDDAAAEPVRQESLAQFRAEELIGARLRLIPAMRLLSLRHDVFWLWQALEDGAEPPPPRPDPISVLVWRNALDVYHRVLAPYEAEAVARSLAGATLEAICTAFGNEDSPAERAHAAIAGWLCDGLIAALELAAETADAQPLALS